MPQPDSQILKLQAVLRDVKGGFVLVKGTSSYWRSLSIYTYDYSSLCYAIRPDGAIAHHWSSSIHESHGALANNFSSPFKRSFCVLSDPGMQHALDTEILWGAGLPFHQSGKFFLSHCGSLAVTVPNAAYLHAQG